MTSANLTVLITILSVGICVAALAYTFLGQAAMARSRTNKRIQAIATPDKVRRSKSTGDTVKDRKRAVQETLDDIEEKQSEKTTRPPLRVQIAKAGLDFSVRTFWTLSVGLVLGVAFLMLIIGQGIIAVVAGFLIGFAGLPRWILSFLRKRREKKFIEEFANALDVIVRGVKSGLPLNECLKIIANEAQEPVRGEFQRVIDAQKIGLPTDQCLGQLFERMSVPEVNFFMIVLIIQQSSGGNLSEALGNLSEVLRTRKQMRAKIQAMSSEAKASAAIIGSLPPGVAFLVYVTSPGYMTELFTTQIGHMMIGGSAIWMATGVFIMRKMINFNF